MNISKERDLKKLLPKNLVGEYAIGLHGLEKPEFWKKDENEKYVIDREQVEKVQQSILENGLRIAGDRNLLSTVKFADLESYIAPNGYYNPGGVIVAIPKMLESTSGQKMFIGSPNEFMQRTNGKNWDRNREATSLSELVLVGEGNVLPPEYILGTYSKDENGIVVNLNERHVSFGNAKVTDEFIEKAKAIVGPAMRDGKLDITAIKETQRQRLQYERTHKKSLIERLSSLKGTREGKKEVSQIFNSWINKTKEREESKEDGTR